MPGPRDGARQSPGQLRFDQPKDLGSWSCPERWSCNDRPGAKITVRLAASCDGCGRQSDPYTIPALVFVDYHAWSRAVYEAVCKTVGIAYVGSNPTPATNKINRLSLGNSIVNLDFR